MITTESEVMQFFRFNRLRIIAVALAALALAGCSMVRLAYSQAPNLTHWWADGYADFNTEQSQQFKQALDGWFDWHRRTQMPVYADLLAKGQREVMGSMTRESMCAWRDEVQRRLEPVVDHVAPKLAAIALTLTPDQLKHMEQRLAKNGADLKRDFAQDDRNERRKASFKRTLERYENLYGRLDEAQRERLAQLLQESPFDADKWLAEREKRSRDTISALSGLVAASKTQDAANAQVQAVGVVKAIAWRALNSPRSDYAAYQQRLSSENCALAATLHNLTTPAQRQHARNKLRSWESDVRTILASDSPTTSNGVPDLTLR
jgi:hypothetical protein